MCVTHSHSYTHIFTWLFSHWRCLCSEIRNYVKIKNTESKRMGKKERAEEKRKSFRKAKSYGVPINSICNLSNFIDRILRLCVRISLGTERRMFISSLCFFFRCVFTNGDTGRITFNYNNAWIRSICATSISYRLNSCAVYTAWRERTVK